MDLESLNQADSLNGVLEIETVEPFLKPLKDHMYNVDNIPRAFMIAGAILAAIIIIWFVDRVMVWAVNNSGKRKEKRRYVIPFYVFPLLLSVAFIIDYISIIFGIFQYPWMSFSVLLIKGSLFLSTSIWAMGVFEVPLAKIFAFLASAAKAWRTKDLDGLDKSMNELTLTKEGRNGVNKKTLSVIALLVLASCFTPKKSVQEVPVAPVEVSIKKVLDKPETIRVYRSAFGESFLIERAKSKRVKARVVEVASEADAGASVGAIEKEKKRDGIPVYFQGQRVGTFHVKNK